MSHSDKSNSNSDTKTNKIVEKTPLYVDKNLSNTVQTPCYIPFCLSSQSGHSHVLYYNANAPADELFDCATARLQAVIDLMENLFEYNTGEKTTLPAVATVSSYLLNDAMTLLQELNPTANALKYDLANTE